MLSIGVKTDIDKAIAALSAFDETQLPFAVSKALNVTAVEAKKKVVALMPTEFTIRRDFVLQGVQVIPSSKTDLVATVWDRDDFMYRQEVGGDKVPVNGRNMLAVPLSSAFNRNEVIPDAMRPRNLANTLMPLGGSKGGAMTGRVTIADGRMFLARLVAGAAKGSRLQFLYRLMPDAAIKPRFRMGETVLAVVEARFGAILSGTLAEAMATRRAGGTLKDK